MYFLHLVPLFTLHYIITVKGLIISKLMLWNSISKGSFSFPPGHKFSLSLNKQTWEYTYDPLEPSTLPRLPAVKPFTTRFCFPDYVISRFLTNLLNVHFSKEGD